MIRSDKSFCLPFYVLSGMAVVLLMQSALFHSIYRMTSGQLLSDMQEALRQACRKEQAYRIPFIDIVNPGPVTIESCGTEEVQIIRKCPEPDTIVYKNPSAYSIETFIDRVFADLREHIEPMNIYCLADLFAGILHEKHIPVYFVIEKFDVSSGVVLDSSLLPDKKQPEMNPASTIVLPVSEREALRAVLRLTPGTVLGRMQGACLCFIFLVIVEATGAVLIIRRGNAKPRGAGEEDETAPAAAGMSGLTPAGLTFALGRYSFIPAKNELQGFGKTLLLNKKENAILYSLCTLCGNVVTRDALLKENWGESGFIYSRSLDTYIATLRKYLKKEASVQIVTIKGVGYKLIR
jgi:DNA-binding response OmpR family regulator